jgi:hypothetical protein
MTKRARARDLLPGDHLAAVRGPFHYRVIDAEVSSIERDGWGYRVKLASGRSEWIDYADQIEIGQQAKEKPDEEA